MTFEIARAIGLLNGMKEILETGEVNKRGVIAVLNEVISILEGKDLAQEIREATIEECARACEAKAWGKHDSDNMQCLKCDSFCCLCETCGCHTNPIEVAKAIRELK